jgi:hypothetical protein
LQSASQSWKSQTNNSGSQTNSPITISLK